MWRSRDFDDVAVAEDGRAFDAVLQLADVARPVVRAQLRPRLGRDAQRRLPQLARELLQEEIDQRVDVLAPRAQRRDGDREDVDAEEEVFAEAALASPRPRECGSWRR